MIKEKLSISMNQNNLSLKETGRSASMQEKPVPKFLKKVFYILEVMSCAKFYRINFKSQENKYSEYISWSDDGTAK
mgnify:CR=1 FL=1